MSVAQLTKDYDNLVGDVLVSAGMIAYSGPFTPDFRQKLVKGWQEKLVELGIPHSDGCDVRLTLADPVQVGNRVLSASRALYMLAVAKEVRARKIENVLRSILVSLPLDGINSFRCQAIRSRNLRLRLSAFPLPLLTTPFRRVFAFRSEVGRSQDFPAMGTQSKTASS